MEANTIIEVNGINYLITQKVIYNKTNYYMVAEMQGQKIVNSYGLIKEVLRDGKVIVDKVVDEKEQIQVYKLLIRDFSKDIEKVNLKNFIPIGEIVKIKDRDFALLDYIPMAKKMYMVFLTTSKPLDMVIARRDIDDKGKMKIVDVTALDEGIKVLRLFSLVHRED